MKASSIGHTSPMNIALFKNFKVQNRVQLAEPLWIQRDQIHHMASFDTICMLLMMTRNFLTQPNPNPLNYAGVEKVLKTSTEDPNDQEG